MRRSTLTLIAATFLTLPLAAQEPTRAEPARRPTEAVRARPAAREGARLSEAQRERIESIRSRYAKDLRSQREATRARREKMRDEFRSVLTAEQRSRLDSRREMMHRRQPVMRARMAQPRAMRGMARVRGAEVGRAATIRGGRGMAVGGRPRVAQMRGRMVAPGARPARPAMRAMPMRPPMGAPAPQGRMRMRQGAPDQAPPAPAAAPAAPARPEGALN